MSLLKRILAQSKKPSGRFGRFLAARMNFGHSSLTKWGLGFIDIKSDIDVFDIGCGGGKTVLKRLLWSFIVVSIIFWFPACSKKQTISIFDDISRDTYENNLRKQREENIGKPNYEEPPTYDQYQRERKELLPDNKVTIPNFKQK